MLGVLLSSVWGILISFWSVLVFSPTLLSLFYYFLHYYYYCLYCCCFYSLLLLLLFPQSSWLCVTGAWAGAGYGGRGLVAGLRVGLACGVLLLPGFGVSSSSPQVPGHPTSIYDAGVNNTLSAYAYRYLHCYRQVFILLQTRFYIVMIACLLYCFGEDIFSN